jgi:drug/metabolite transporter (DMT)-like permease
VTQALPNLAFAIALKSISSGALTMSLALIPLFTRLMAHVLRHQERLALGKAAGQALGFSGLLFPLATRTPPLETARG